MDKLNVSNGINQHKAMATGGKMAEGDFGVKSWDCHDGDKMGSKADMMKGPMGDGGRGADKPVKHTKGKMAGQAAPDHGPHK
jgi:hypothetical protein